MNGPDDPTVLDAAEARILAEIDKAESVSYGQCVICRERIMRVYSLNTRWQWRTVSYLTEGAGHEHQLKAA